MADTPERSSAQWADLGMAWNAVIEFTAAVAVYGVLGWFADAWLNTKPALFLVGLVSGMVLGIYILYKRAEQAETNRVMGRSHRARD